MKLDCSGSNHCTGLRLQDIKLTYMRRSSASYCRNAHGRASGVMVPRNCMWNHDPWLFIWVYIVHVNPKIVGCRYILKWYLFDVFITLDSSEFECGETLWCEWNWKKGKREKKSIWLFAYQCACAISALLVKINFVTVIGHIITRDNKIVNLIPKKVTSFFFFFDKRLGLTKVPSDRSNWLIFILFDG